MSAKYYRVIVCEYQQEILSLYREMAEKNPEVEVIIFDTYDSIIIGMEAAICEKEPEIIVVTGKIHGICLEHVVRRIRVRYNYIGQIIAGSGVPRRNKELFAAGANLHLHQRPSVKVDRNAPCKALGPGQVLEWLGLGYV